jgi:DNA-binding NarL/FixJ family response regulator
MITVLIADDHTLLREGLKQILASTPDIVVADEAGDGKEVLKKVGERDYDVILLDIAMPGRNGIDICKQLKRSKSHQNILMLSMYPEEQLALRSLRAGAAGYLTKKSVSTELITAIRKVSKGERHISTSLADALASDLTNRSSKPAHEILSDREYEIMCMIATGKTITEIARELLLSKNTISTHRTRLLKKMNLKTNAELTYYAFKNRLVG